MSQSAFSLIDTQYVRALCEHLDDEVLAPERVETSRFASLPRLKPPTPSTNTPVSAAPKLSLPQETVTKTAGLDEDTDPSDIEHEQAKNALHQLKSLLSATGQLRIVERLNQTLDTLLESTGSSAGFLSDDAGLSLLDTNVDEEYIIMGTTLWSSVYDWHLDERVYGNYAVMQTQHEDNVLHLFCFSIDVGRFIIGLVAEEVFRASLFKALSQAIETPTLSTAQLEHEPS